MSDTNTPISVPSSATGDQLASALRALLIALGSYGVGKGWFDAGLVAAAIPVILIGWPVIWAQLKVRSSHAKMVTMADAAPPSVANVAKP